MRAAARNWSGVFREYGLPRVIRSDNGPPFASTGVGGLTRLGVWWVKLGIRPERIAPGKPEQNGRHERLHKTLKAETATPPAANLAQQQQVVVGSLILRSGDLSATRAAVPADVAEAARRRLLVPLLDIVEGTAVYDEQEADKQPDWTFDAVDSGTYPAQRLQDIPLASSR